MEQNPITEPEPSPELTAAPPTFKDSVILVFENKLQLEVYGGEKAAGRFLRRWRHKAVMMADGRPVRFRGRDVLFTQVVPAGEKARKAAEAEEKAEAERKKNPNPGREPKHTTPGRH